jgi:signal transduction histidine kinase
MRGSREDAGRPGAEVWPLHHGGVPVTLDPTALMLQRTRGGMVLILTTIALFAVLDLGIDAAAFPAAYGLKLLHALLITGLLASLWWVTDAGRWTTTAALLAVNGTFVLMAIGDVVKGHVETTPLLAVVAALASAALLPWGVRPQLGSVTLMWVGTFLALVASGRPVQTLVDPVGSVAAALGVSVYVAYEFARYRAERRAAEAALHRLVDELDRANRTKLEFVSTMSHELRTPLNIIAGYGDMLRDDDFPDRARALDGIRRANAELLELIEATLDLNRLESGRDQPRLAPVAVQELWDELSTELAAVPRADGVCVEWRPAVGVVLLSDRRKLKMILKNLVGNALKFTPRGRVDVGCRLEAAHCVLSVSDTGIGIPAEHLTSVFEPFRQVVGSDRRHYGGVGLGLHIVRRLCSQLGADVTLASQPGRGSTFTIRLPLTGPAARAA